MFSLQGFSHSFCYVGMVRGLSLRPFLKWLTTILTSLLAPKPKALNPKLKTQNSKP